MVIFWLIYPGLWPLYSSYTESEISCTRSSRPVKLFRSFFFSACVTFPLFWGINVRCMNRYIFGVPEFFFSGRISIIHVYRFNVLCSRFRILGHVKIYDCYLYVFSCNFTVNVAVNAEVYFTSWSLYLDSFVRVLYTWLYMFYDYFI